MPPTAPRNSNRGKENYTLNNYPAITCRWRLRVEPDSSDLQLDIQGRIRQIEAFQIVRRNCSLPGKLAECCPARLNGALPMSKDKTIFLLTILSAK
jgi:hypothetical protein